MKRLIFVFLFILLVVVGFATTTPPIIQPASENNSGNLDKELPTVGSYEKLVSLLEDARKNNPYNGQHMYGGGGVKRAPSMAVDSREAASAYSETNTQVAGVDEADLVKTDGKFIYLVSGQQVSIVQASPIQEMKSVKKIKYDQSSEEKFTPLELYVDDKYLVVIGNSFRTPPVPQNPGKGIYNQAYPFSSSVKVIIYDIRDKSNIRQVRDAEVDGQYISSRKIGTGLYLVTNKYIDTYLIQNEPRYAVPGCKDSAVQGGTVKIDYNNIRYIPNSVNSNYLIIAGLRLDKPSEEMQVSTYLGAGQNIYASQENLYIATTQYNTNNSQPQANTLLYKFSLRDGKTAYRAKGDIPGIILNQFAMDEDKGNFRIATTSGEVWNNTSANNLYILNESLEPLGKIENMAPGEKIYSVRFMGERGYIVTFKKVDPLFVVDLKDPQKPTVLGTLKIPGYSDYLHPYDDKHIIGFGKDTVELPNQYNGEITAYYQGMKVALFDITDVTHPIEMFKESIGARGTDSELLRNHKALLFDRSRNLLAFPVSVFEDQGLAPGPGNMPRYGQFTYQGAYVYTLDLTNGFTLKGKITHGATQNSNIPGNNFDKNIKRILYIGNNLYTVSPSIIKANSWPSLKEINNLTID